ncbi:SGNH/GDSL hydrolase family protein [Microbacterium sp. 1P10UB]|uniref:SGNH/GDSL hydrolase family protein n=1 Tax=unclassified Microbacterium TaxID=2609290 RepID=UPI00399F7682
MRALRFSPLVVRRLVALSTAALVLTTAGCAAEQTEHGPATVATPSTSPTSSALSGPDGAEGEGAAYAAGTADDTVGGGVIVTIGDSIMAGYGLDPDEAWPALMADTTGRDVVNISCSGAGFVAVGDCDTDFAGLIGEAAAQHPSLIIVQSSDNDADEDADDLDAATMDAVTALHDAAPDARIVGLSTLWNPSWDAPDAIAWSSDALQAAVEAVGGRFVDIGQPLHDRADLLQWDEEHPNVAGQRELRTTVLSALAESDITL